jgi:hypothetical protein
MDSWGANFFAPHELPAGLLSGTEFIREGGISDDADTLMYQPFPG